MRISLCWVLAAVLKPTPCPKILNWRANLNVRRSRDYDRIPLEINLADLMRIGQLAFIQYLSGYKCYPQVSFDLIQQVDYGIRLYGEPLVSAPNSSSGRPTHSPE